MITKITNNAMCNKGTIARNMEFKTTCKPAKTQNIENIRKCAKKVLALLLILCCATAITNAQSQQMENNSSHFLS